VRTRGMVTISRRRLFCESFQRSIQYVTIPWISLLRALRSPRSADCCLSDQPHDRWCKQTDTNHHNPILDDTVWFLGYALPEPETGEQGKHENRPHGLRNKQAAELRFDSASLVLIQKFKLIPHGLSFIQCYSSGVAARLLPAGDSSICYSFAFRDEPEPVPIPMRLISIGLKPTARAGEFGERLKSPFAGSAKRGSVAMLLSSEPCLCSAARWRLPHAGSAVFQ